MRVPVLLALCAAACASDEAEVSREAAILAAIGGGVHVFDDEGEYRGLLFERDSSAAARAVEYDREHDVVFWTQGRETVGLFLFEEPREVVLLDEEYDAEQPWDAGAMKNDTYFAFRRSQSVSLRPGEFTQTSIWSIRRGTRSAHVDSVFHSDDLFVDIDVASDGAIFGLTLERRLRQTWGTRSHIPSALLPSYPSTPSYASLAVSPADDLFVGAAQATRWPEFAVVLLKYRFEDELPVEVARLDAPADVESWEVYSIDAVDGQVVAAVRFDEEVGLLFADEDLATQRFVPVQEATLEAPIRSVVFADFPVDYVR